MPLARAAPRSRPNSDPPGSRPGRQRGSWAEKVAAARGDPLTEVV